MSEHEQYMERCIELALRGQGFVAPNPMVGCVLVHDGQIISEGWHRQFGGNHAERDAILKIQGDSRLKESTLYVNLEPCAHTGKTPPCSHLIIDSGIKRVVFGSSDPYDLVNGKGLDYLKKNGVEVIGPILNSKCQELNRRFFTFHLKKRPYIILKWAETMDGFMAKENREKFQISGEDSKMLLHKWRSEEQAILVGANTAVFDSPQLNVRFWKGKQPTAVFLDPTLKGDYNYRVNRTLVYNNVKSEINGSTEFIQCMNEDLIAEMIESLWKKNICSIIVEGGADTLQRFIDQEIYDEIRVIKSSKVQLGKGIAAPKFHCNLKETFLLSSDTVEVFQA